MFEISGSSLKKIREERQIPLEKIASSTHIRLSILKDLEEEEYTQLGSPTQVRGFLKIYADFLGVKSEEKPEPLAESPVAKEAIPTAKEQNSAEIQRLSFPLQSTADSSPKKQTRIGKRQGLINWSKSLLRRGKTNVISEKDERPEAPSYGQQILFEIGHELSARRRYLNIPWELIVEHTHIKKQDLVALEQGNLDALSSPIRAKGLLQNYARFLNLNADLILIRFVDALQERRIENSSQSTKERKSSEVISPFFLTLKRFFTLDLFFGSILVIGILAFLIWGIARTSSLNLNTQTTETLPAVIDVLLTTPTPEGGASAGTGTITPSPGQNSLPTPTPFYLSIMPSNTAYEIVLLAHQNVWIRVIADTKLTYQGRLASGNVMTFTGNESIELETGNSAALEIIFNQSPINFTGSLGEPAHFLFNEAGMTQLSASPEGSTTPAKPTPTTTLQPSNFP